MKLKRIFVGGLTLLIGLPVLFVLAIVTGIHLLDRTNGTITSSDEQREYLLYVPPGYDAKKPTPLVISMHGAAAWPAQQKNLSQWNRLADKRGFIVVYPSGNDSPKIWHIAGGAALDRDVRFISDLIDTLQKTYNIDPTRIYANGISAGAGMAFALSCTLSDRIAAVGLVATALQFPPNWCTDTKPVPMIAFHGTSDPFVPYDGGLPQGSFAPTRFDPNAKPFPSVSDWTAHWAQRNRCGVSPTKSLAAADVARIEYTNCDQGSAVVLYTIQGGGHTWPGGKQLPEWMVGSTSNSVDATVEMWEFFRKHQLGN
jgi:polyhydroxybutyrate depolymerase